MITFSELGLSADLLKVLPELGIEQPSEIQEKAIPILLNNETDFIGLAQTGTGKTAAFGLPLIDQIDTKLVEVQGVVLAPTRELGLQITDQLTKFAKYKRGLRVEAVYGGANIVGQMKALKRGVHIVVATPGRLIDLLNRKAISLDDIKIVVLDEADEMLNMGFREDIDEILSHTARAKRTWLFSATMSKGIRKIVEEYMDDPQEVTIGGKQAVNKNIEHQYLLAGKSKRDSLKHYIDVYDNVRGIVFCKTKAETKELSDDLKAEGCSVDAINGDLSQAAREQVMKKFKNHTLDILVATDVAARGIDVNDLTHVFHFNIPDDLEYYTHRSGRTARAGKKGVSILFLRKGDQRRLSFLERNLNINFEEIKLPGRKEIAMSKTLESVKNLVEFKADISLNPEYIQEINEVFADISKEDLIKKLVGIELNRFGFSVKESKPDSFSGDDERRSPRERDSRRSDSRSSRDSDERRPRSDSRSSRDSDERRPRRERTSSRDDRGGRDERSPRNSRDDRFSREKSDEKRPRERSTDRGGNYERFSINMGKKDGVRKLDLLDFICEQTGLNKKSIGDIDVESKQAYFQVEKNKSNGIDALFEGVEVNGRQLRVSKENTK